MSITTDDHRRQLTMEDATESVLLLKQVLKPDKLEAVYEAIFAFNRREIDSSAMVYTVSHLLCGHSNLIRSINTFLPETHKAQDYSLIIRQIEFVNAINRRFRKDPEIFRSFVKIMESHANDSAVAHQKVSDLFRDFPEVIRAFESFLPERNRDGSGRCGPSYKRRTMLSHSSGRSELESEVLNEDWVCDAPKAIWSARPAMDERQAAVLECEDERYEMDMMIERGRSAKKRIKRKEELTVIDLRYIQKLYGERGLQVVEIVKKDEEELALPIVRERIKQKVAELRRRRTEMNRQWAKVYQGTDAMQCD